MAQIKWSYNKADGSFIDGGKFEPDIRLPDGTVDATKGIATLTRMPDKRTEKYDEVGGVIIAKSQAEINAYDDTVNDAKFLDLKSDLFVLFESLVIELAAELPGVTAQQLGDRIKARFKTRKEQ